jgi:hypothetical protein
MDVTSFSIAVCRNDVSIHTVDIMVRRESREMLRRLPESGRGETATSTGT